MLFPTIMRQRFVQAAARLPAIKKLAARRFCSKGGEAKEAAKEVVEKKHFLNTAEFWGACGAIAGWGMTGAAIYDASNAGPEIISLKMTGVMIVYSSLFARWAWVVKPQNLLLCSCHVSNVFAQCNQMRRAIEHMQANGKEEEVAEMGQMAGMAAAGTAVLIAAGPTLRGALTGAGLGPLSAIAAAEAGPFTVHFWAPMSKWAISGASFMDLERPTDKVSLPQYTALTLTGFFFSRCALVDFLTPNP